MAKIRTPDLSLNDRQERLLRPYLVGERPRDNGEWDMYCPLHQDATRSAQLNIERGVWFCHAGCGGGSVAELVRRKAEWVPPTAAALNGAGVGSRRRERKAAEEINEAKVVGWNQALLANEIALGDLVATRGIHTKTVIDFEIGWDSDSNAYTLPVRAPDRTFWNVRRYQIRPPAGRRKIWSVDGMGSPRLYPISVFERDPAEVVICEGELDALITIQHGFPAITRTGAAKVWKAEWSEYFAGRTVYLAHDTDDAGDEANRRVGRALMKVAKVVRVVQLPYPHVEKRGNDLTDYWLEHDGEPDAFRRLLDEAEPFDSSRSVEPERLDPSDATVLDSFDSRRVGDPLRLTVTIKGKRDPGYSVPRKAHYTCTRDAGQKCAICPLYSSGDDERVIAGADPLILELTDSSKKQVRAALRNAYGIPECNKLHIEVTEHQAVEILFARPSVDHTAGENAEDYKNMKLTSVGRHDTLPNNTVQVVGALQPDPRSQLNEFLAWDISRMETSLDRFEMDSQTAKLLKRFRPSRSQRPLSKLGEIARALAAHVTRIYGRPEMHAAMDLAFHSVLGFDFSGKRIHRGWLDILVVGDTRTGKSEAAARLSRYYGAGEIVSGETATFAGIVGGLQQFGSAKEWAITWGAIPINDRRLVVMDEVGGLQPEEIAQMSSVRSSGTAELHKIQQERTFARTRLIWLGNPRNARMSDYTYGVQAIRPLIGNAEDIARFDLAMSVRAEDVAATEINREHDPGKNRYTAEACSTLLRWVWSRTPDQVNWTRGAERAVYRAANDLGSRYVEDPPLIQAANVREKVARVAVALAARLFSTDATYERIVVRPEHVRDAVAFIDRIYSLPSFGYAERSREIIADRKEARGNVKDAKTYLYKKRGLAKFLRGAGKFRRQDLEEILNVDREQANAIIATLWGWRMVRKDKGDVRVEPALHDLLREINL